MQRSTKVCVVLSRSLSSGVSPSIVRLLFLFAVTTFAKGVLKPERSEVDSVISFPAGFGLLTGAGGTAQALIVVDRINHRLQQVDFKTGGLV